MGLDAGAANINLLAELVFTRTHGKLLKSINIY